MDVIIYIATVSRIQRYPEIFTTILFEIITFKFENHENHATVIADNSWEFLRGIVPATAFCKTNKETVTVVSINSRDP